MTVAVATDNAQQAPVGTLGFPLVATRNTTRISGPDPTADAAAAALATHPPAPGAPPVEAVVLVAEDDWQAGIAASVLAGPPLRAPVLIGQSRRRPRLDRAGARAAQPARRHGLGRRRGLPGRRRRSPVRPAGRGDRRRLLRRRARRLDRRAPPEPAAGETRSTSSSPAPTSPPTRCRPPPGPPAPATRCCSAARTRSRRRRSRALRRHQRRRRLHPRPGVRDLQAGGAGDRTGLGRAPSGSAEPGPVQNAIAFARYSDSSFGWNINDPGHGLVLANTARPLDAAAAASLSSSGKWGPLLLTDTRGYAAARS